MAGFVRELLVSLGIDADTADVLDYDRAIDGLKWTMEVAVKAAVALAGAVSAIVGVTSAAVVTTSTYSQEVSRNAEALGLTTDAYQELFYAVGRFGQNTGDFLDTMNQIAQYTQMAQTGSKQAIDTFAALGLKTEDLQGMGLDELLGRLADGLTRIEDPALRAGYASSIFGEEGTRQLLPMLVKGSAGIEELRRQASELGIVLDEKAIKASAEFALELGDMKVRAEALWHTIGILLLPIFQDVIDRVQAWMEAHKDLIQTDLPHYLELIAEKGKLVVAWADDLRERFSTWEAVSPILTRVAAGLSAVALGVVALRAVSLGWSIATLLVGAASMGPLLLVVGSALVYVAGLFSVWYAVIQDVYTYFAGGDSVLGRLIERFPQIGSVIEAASRVGGAAAALFSAQLETLGILVDSVILPIIQRLAAAMGYDLPNLGAGAEVFLNLLTLALNGLADALSYVVGQGLAFNAWLGGAGGQAAMGGLVAGVTQAPVAVLGGGTPASSPTATYAATTAGAGAAAESSKSYRTGDVNVSVTGAGWTADDVKRLASDVVAEHNRSALAAYGGA